ncbi:hypothetical protein ACLMAL_25745 [Nocardia sp. CWNU-33]|uniref:hypothetical protein n=1 Tax=Nocardia sp. CWNU-33 TaxID=3392117 RepID=UPI00398EBCB6
MTNLETSGLAPRFAGIEPATASTPLRRAAGRLQAVLPPGWRVEIVDTPTVGGRDHQPVLRVVMAGS